VSWGRWQAIAAWGPGRVAVSTQAVGAQATVRQLVRVPAQATELVEQS
jgi:hypothetical protein